MTIVLVESQPDPASVGIAHELRMRGNPQPTPFAFDGSPVLRFPQLLDAHLVRTPALHIQDERMDERLRAAGLAPSLIVFLSKHKSESGRPTLTAHPMGNLGENKFGGEARTLTPTAGPWLSQALRCLQQARDANAYPADVSFEATHHGPLLSTPSFFIELGSSEREWDDPKGHHVLADAVERLLARPPPEFPIVIGLGGGHYGPRFTEAVLARQVHVAHMIPTYHAKEATGIEHLAAEAVRASPGAKRIYYQDGTIPREPRERWLAAFNGLGLSTSTSKDWPPLAAP